MTECHLFTFRTLKQFAILGVLLFLVGCGQSKEKHLANGEQFLQKRRFEEALMEFRAAADIDSGSAEAHWGLARAHESLEQFNDALEEVRKTVGLAPDNLEAKVKLGNYQLLFQPPMIGETEQIISDVIGRDPKFVEAHVLKASLLTVQNKPEAEIVGVLNQAIALDPARTETHISLARYFMRADKIADAEKAIQNGIAARPDRALGYVEYGRFLTYAARLPEAEQQLIKATQTEPTGFDALDALADFYVTTRQLPKAEAAYKELVRIQENSPDARIVLAGFYADAGRIDDAVATLTQIIQESPEYVRARYRLGEIYLDRRDPAKVTEQIEALLKINDRDAQALLLRARLAVQLNKVPDAVTDLETILKKLPSHREALYLMTEARLALGQNEQARAFLGDLEKYHPNYLRARLLKIQIEFADGRADAAWRIANEVFNTSKGIVTDSAKMAREISDIRFKALTSRGLASLRLAKLDEAQADLAEVLRLAPKSSAAMVNLARVLAAKNDLATAARFYNDALTADQDNFDALSGVISVLQSQRQFAPAQAKLDEFLARNAERPDVRAALHYLKADTFLAEKKQPEAEDELRKSLAADENYLPAYSTLAGIYASRNQIDEALAQYRAAIAKRPAPTTLTMIGMLEESRGNLAEAEKNYRKALDLAPDSPVAANNLAWLIAENGQGNLDEALRLSQTVVSRNQNVAGYFDTLGLVFFKKGLNSQAVEQFRKAVVLDEADAKRVGGQPNPGYRVRYAAALATSGDKVAARREVELSLADQTRLTEKELQEARSLLASL